ncbi:uncharacterized protein LOC127000512 [Eriocheir sinensis]|uniref:uncharacterized protein LOC127000512 n=1 Tax=Eriocheir sinensis TaxID=95602 RepID=UPI0021C9F5CB|nr:uncharacterized protein LOC127000512 [Eriocheir sinensis]XP_050720204.1 uncharacterized protein LOC127000512 [Eriocheir sinensis]
MLRTATLSVCRAWGGVSLRAPAATITTSTRVDHFVSETSFTLAEPADEQALMWRFPADDRTQAMMVSVEHGLSQTSTITLNSKAPITPDLMEAALGHVYDKIASLRLCLRQRQGQLWLADMPQRKLDFQVVSGTDFEEEHAAIEKSPFNLHEGPLWKARLMPCPADAPCAFPEVKAAFPHHCHLFVSANHAFSDGVVMITMKNLLLGILDSLLEGSPVDTTPVGELRDSVEVREEEKRIKAELESDPERLTEALRKLSMSKHLPLLMEAYGVPNEAHEANQSTKYLQPVLLDNQMIEKIAAKSRSIGATLNSCFIAALNVSMMELAREGGLERDVYNLSTRHPVDSRRLMKGVKSLPLGFHAMPISQYTSTPRDVKKDFWQYLQRLDTELREKLSKNYMCEQRVLEAMLKAQGFTLEATSSQSPPVYDCDYIFSNLYSPKASPQQGVGKNVQITMEGNYMSVQSEKIAVGQALFSSRGKARLQAAYSTAAITRSVAERILQKNVAMLHDISRMVD